MCTRSRYITSKIPKKDRKREEEMADDELVAKKSRN
jgi:hypothetical protein